jgi:hypothetical protein
MIILFCIIGTFLRIMSCDVRVIVDEAILGLLVDEAVDGDVGLVVILLADKSAGRRESTGNEDLEAVAVAVAVAVGVAAPAGEGMVSLPPRPLVLVISSRFIPSRSSCRMGSS